MERLPIKHHEKDVTKSLGITTDDIVKLLSSNIKLKDIFNDPVALRVVSYLLAQDFGINGVFLLNPKDLVINDQRVEITLSQLVEKIEDFLVELYQIDEDALYSILTAILQDDTSNSKTA